MNQKSIVVITKVLVAALCCVFGFLALLKLIEVYQEHCARELALEDEVRRRLAPGYKQKNMLRIINPGPHDVRTLRINYDGNSVEVHDLKSGYMFRHLVIAGSTAEVEFIYSDVDGNEYKLKEEGFGPPNEEIAYVIKGAEIHGRAFGPIDANEKTGLSPVRSLTMRFHIAKEKGALQKLKFVKCAVADIGSDLKDKFDFEFPNGSKELKLAKVEIIEGLTAFIAKFSMTPKLLDEFLFSLSNTQFTPYDAKNDPRTYSSLPLPDWFKEGAIERGKLGHFGSDEKGIHYIIDLDNTDKYVVCVIGSY